MPRTCTVCAHEERDAIDSALVRGEPLRNIARREGLDHTALHRHKQAHVSPAIARVYEQREEHRGEKLLDRVEDLYDKASGILDAAAQDGKPSLSLSAIRELRGIVELLGKLTGELDDRPQQTVNVLVASEWQTIKAALLDALAPYPEARAAASIALQALRAGS